MNFNKKPKVLLKPFDAALWKGLRCKILETIQCCYVEDLITVIRENHAMLKFLKTLYCYKVEDLAILNF